MALIMDIAPPKALPPRRRLSRPALAVAGIMVVLLLAGLVFLWRPTATTSPVPLQVREAVAFQIYYPKQQKLPSGYSLDTTSFHLAQPGVVIYSVVYHGNQRLVF